jgi:parallel beta-helix repeat protein
MSGLRWLPKLAASVLVAVLGVGLSAVGADAQAVTLGCGAVVTTDVVLAADIGPCHDHAIIVGADNITVDLNGHQLFGEGGAVVVHQASGVFVDNHTGVTVTNGTIHSFYHGVRVRRGGSNLVTGITARGNAGGNGIVFETSSDNVAMYNTIHGNSGFAGMATFNTNALPPAAARNSFINNIVSGNRAHGISIEAGPGHILRGNQVAGNTRDGISVFSPSTNVTVEANQVSMNGANGVNIRAGVTGSTVRSNAAHQNAQHGILVSGTSNQMLGNNARGNLVLDLRDTNTNCDANLWSGNGFGTASPACTQA